MLICACVCFSVQFMFRHTLKSHIIWYQPGNLKKVSEKSLKSVIKWYYFDELIFLIAPECTNFSVMKPPDSLFTASRLQRSQITAVVKLQKGSLELSDLMKLQISQHMLWKSHWKVIEFYWWIFIWTMNACYTVLLLHMARIKIRQVTS